MICSTSAIRYRGTIAAIFGRRTGDVAVAQLQIRSHEKLTFPGRPVPIETDQEKCDEMMKKKCRSGSYCCAREKVHGTLFGCCCPNASDTCLPKTGFWGEPDCKCLRLGGGLDNAGGGYPV